MEVVLERKVRAFKTRQKTDDAKPKQTFSLSWDPWSIAVLSQKFPFVC